MTVDMGAMAALEQQLRAGRIAHAYLFVGLPGTGKVDTALALACCLNCDQVQEPTPEPCGQCAACQKVLSGNHRDVHMLAPAGGVIKRDPVHEWMGHLRLARAEARYRVGILAEADLLTAAAANHLLKLLEEPLPRTVIVLLTAREFTLLPTIRSRLRRLRFSGPAPAALRRSLQEDHGLSRQQARICTGVAAGDPSLAKELAADETFWQTREELLTRLGDLAAGDAFHAFQLAGALSQHDRSQLKQRLTIMVSLLRDAVVLAGGAAADASGLPRLMHPDLEAPLRRWVRRADRQALLYAIRSLMGVPRLLDANVNARLTLETALLRLQRSLKGERGAAAVAGMKADPLLKGPGP